MTSNSSPTSLVLRADCGSCRGLCCVVPAFAASADFAVDKPARRPCANLLADSRCGIHDSLRDKGFVGCTVYDCFGAGQRVSALFDGRDWRDGASTATPMFAAFPVMRDLHELLWYLSAAARFDDVAPLRSSIEAETRRIEGLAARPPSELVRIDVDGCRRAANVVLTQASEAARSRFRRRRDHRGADLVGARLSGADLRGASLRGSLLLGANLSGADLRSADVIGTDLRGSDLRGADLSGALFLTQAQLDSAVGDGRTRMSAPLRRPGHWPE
ncbi:pentapeptide repeat-containing protein [Stackebrandtia soli]|uniref:pentapeptide repeat-containing protein n=1 Tax=Stackebrandtia soli TaxID=1892856 RepID=UPI0039E9C8E8